MKVAYLGPVGTFTEEAAFRYALEYDKGAELLPYPTILAVAAAVRSGEADRGVAPVENSVQGTVTDTLDVLIHEEGMSVCDELVLPIAHNLISKPGTAIGDVRVVYSHPQALGQCRIYLERALPQAELRASLSTAAAVLEMERSQEAAAAISTRRAADLYGAELLVEEIQDNANNATRFLVLATEDSAPTGCDRTSICFSFAEDKPGQLFGIMRVMAEREINLSKVESRPTREGLGQYYFLLDLEGHREDSSIRTALEEVARSTSMLKVFGSYPRFIMPEEAG
jgi:prephenate dehydratase